MDEMTRTNTRANVVVTDYIKCAQTRENVTCEGLLFTHPVGCSRLPSAVNDLATTNSKTINYEIHQFSFRCHHEVLDEEEDECHLWYC